MHSNQPADISNTTEWQGVSSVPHVVMSNGGPIVAPSGMVSASLTTGDCSQRSRTQESHDVVVLRWLLHWAVRRSKAIGGRYSPGQSGGTRRGWLKCYASMTLFVLLKR